MKIINARSGRSIPAVLIISGMMGWSLPVEAAGYSAKHHEIVSQLHVMAQGTYTKAEWESVIQKLDGLLAETRQAGDDDGVVETQVLRARVMAARGNRPEALALMQQTLAEYRDRSVPSLRKVYVELATLYAHAGDEPSVARTMREFKESPHYDGQAYSYSGGSEPGDPLVIVRPRETGSDSVSMTAMKVQQTQSRFAPGQVFPDFNAIDWNGRELSRLSFPQNVVLVDFWTDGWFLWERDLEYRKGIYARYQAKGFEVLGMYIGYDQAAARQFAKNRGMTWTLADAPRPLLKSLGLFGTVANFLLDKHGTIIARDLYGADLDAAVRQAVNR
jgi:hypothetical protein